MIKIKFKKKPQVQKHICLSWICNPRVRALWFHLFPSWRLSSEMSTGLQLAEFSFDHWISPQQSQSHPIANVIDVPSLIFLGGQGTIVLFGVLKHKRSKCVLCCHQEQSTDEETAILFGEGRTLWGCLVKESLNLPSVEWGVDSTWGCCSRNL
jgi:hypothetical protein